MLTERYNTEIKELGRKLKKLREDKDLTQFDLEAICGIDRGDISRIENGHLDIKFSSSVKLAAALEVETHELFIFERLSPELIKVSKNKINTITRPNPSKKSKKASEKKLPKK